MMWREVSAGQVATQAGKRNQRGKALPQYRYSVIADEEPHTASLNVWFVHVEFGVMVTVSANAAREDENKLDERRVDASCAGGDVYSTETCDRCSNNDESMSMIAS